MTKIDVELSANDISRLIYALQEKLIRQHGSVEVHNGHANMNLKEIIEKNHALLERLRKIRREIHRDNYGKKRNRSDEDERQENPKNKIDHLSPELNCTFVCDPKEIDFLSARHGPPHFFRYGVFYVAAGPAQKDLLVWRQGGWPNPSEKDAASGVPDKRVGAVEAPETTTNTDSSYRDRIVAFRAALDRREFPEDAILLRDSAEEKFVLALCEMRGSCSEHLAFRGGMVAWGDAAKAVLPLRSARQKAEGKAPLIETDRAMTIVRRTLSSCARAGMIAPMPGVLDTIERKIEVAFLDEACK